MFYLCTQILASSGFWNTPFLLPYLLWSQKPWCLVLRGAQQPLLTCWRVMWEGISLLPGNGGQALGPEGAPLVESEKDWLGGGRAMTLERVGQVLWA